MTVPLIVAVALGVGAANGGFSGGGAGSAAPSGPLPAVTAPSPPNAATQQAACTRVLEKLPVSLGKLAPRTVHTAASTVVAWGEPAVVLSCGVARPKALHPGSSTEFVAGGELSGPYYDVTKRGNANVYTTVDRAAYVAVTIPSKYQGADYLPPLSRAIAAALPPVCTTDNTAPDPAKLCTRRPA